jgi:hypothetical protein
LGRQCLEPADLYLFGGSALLLLGAGRHTGDLDFTVNAAHAESLRALINAVANELGLDVEESVPSEFMPLPSGAEERHRLIGHFGPLTAYIFDPYSIAIMKIDRSFKTDLQDVLFLIDAGIIELDRLESCVEDVASRYEEPLTFRRKFEELKRLLKP